MADPLRRNRPSFPEGYGLPTSEEGLLDWPDIDAKLVVAEHYWMSTTRPDGRPHVVPRWGAWLSGCLYYDGSPETVHATNARSNKACTLHIGDGAEAIIADGATGASQPIEGEIASTLAAEIARKYGAKGYEPPENSWSGEDAGGLMIFRPHKVLAWSDFATDPTRFFFAQ